MSITLKTEPKALAQFALRLYDGLDADKATVEVNRNTLSAMLQDAMAAHELHGLINRPHTDHFLEATRLEAAHQSDRFGAAHDRNKSAENWFWLVGYLAGKCLRAVITGDKEKALHHTISSAAALLNWHEAIKHDKTGAGAGTDSDIAPKEVERMLTKPIPVVSLHPDMYSGR